MARKNRTIGLVSLGCAKNAVDLQVMMGHLLQAGFTLASYEDVTDAILVNTCAFIKEARAEAISEIMAACDMKRAGRTRAVIVSGCLPERYREELTAHFPEVDAFVGIDALDQIVPILNAVLRARPSRKSSRPRCAFTVGEPTRVFDPPVPAFRLTGPAYAYLKIAEGCLHRCAYCAIPGIRGNYRSRTEEGILKEAEALIATGVKELNIVAQDPMTWGMDLKPRRNLVQLLRALEKIAGDFRIRVLYSYPSEISDAFLAWLATSPKAVKYVDVPLQHTVPKILKAMARGGAIDATREAAARIRKAVPGVTLRTTVMTGFPGETDADFQQLLRDVKRMKFDRLGAFIFSPEEGTPAAELPDKPSHAIAKRRLRELMALQREIWTQKAQRLIGKKQRVLVTAPGVGRLASQAPDVDGVTYLKGAADVGTFVDVRITKVKGFDFNAEIL